MNYKEMISLSHSCYTSKIEPKITRRLSDEFWIISMQKELSQFRHNEVWDLVQKPQHVNVIGTKWIFKNKTDEEGNINRNKACPVDQGYTQVEGVDFNEPFTPVARLEPI